MPNKTRLRLCCQYRLHSLKRAAVIYLAIFAAVDLLVPAVLYLLFRIKTGYGDGTSTFGLDQNFPGSFSFWISTAIFLFAGACASFREEFNYLLLLNNTRRNQFWSNLPLMVLTAGFFLTVNLVVKILELMNEALINQRSAAILLDLYFDQFTGARLPAVLANLLLYFATFLLAYAFGQAAGILAYRFGRLFVVPFWICFGFSFIVIPILYAGNQLFQKFVIWFFALEHLVPSFNLSIHILVLAALLIALTGLVYRRLPQSA
ncbi:MAG TPA: hypothetical protein DD640_01850 [Clostridiales bacterium]|nr:hypothetical protein [Clostridiales bacterium]